MHFFEGVAAPAKLWNEEPDMASVRAQEVAEILWELKRAAKVAKYSIIAERAGFSAGSKGRAMVTTLRAVRRDWPHLEWWRALKDDGILIKESEQVQLLREAGYELEDADGHEEAVVIVKSLEEHLMEWGRPEGETAEATAG
jgi:alkylated DNA nucleotide flippase Atl1